MTARVTRIFLLLCLLSGICSAQTTYEKLVEALKQDNPERAVTLSEMLEVEGRLSFGLFYNQGLAYRNLGQNARARASFEQALLYEPAPGTGLHVLRVPTKPGLGAHAPASRAAAKRRGSGR